ncbi:hypothetical protein GCM10009665_74440 [Kitasatospora nipponensis]|uniref:Uncharacterized protein n=1 Tax=Kitasatospora nipponensis TaxID=258049 RepID=A0ABN1T7R3_9ACTN
MGRDEGADGGPAAGGTGAAGQAGAAEEAVTVVSFFDQEQERVREKEREFTLQRLAAGASLRQWVKPAVRHDIWQSLQEARQHRGDARQEITTEVPTEVERARAAKELAALLDRYRDTVRLEPLLSVESLTGRRRDGDWAAGELRGTGRPLRAGRRAVDGRMVTRWSPAEQSPGRRTPTTVGALTVTLRATWYYDYWHDRSDRAARTWTESVAAGRSLATVTVDRIDPRRRAWLELVVADAAWAEGQPGRAPLLVGGPRPALVNLHVLEGTRRGRIPARVPRRSSS